MDQNGHVMTNRADTKSHGKFAFTTDKDVSYQICFASRVQQGQSAMIHDVTLSTKHGVEAKSYEAVSYVLFSSICCMLVRYYINYVGLLSYHTFQAVNMVWY